MTPLSAYRAGIRVGPLADAYRAMMRAKRAARAVAEKRCPGRTGAPTKTERLRKRMADLGRRGGIKGGPARLAQVGREGMRAMAIKGGLARQAQPRSGPNPQVRRADGRFGGSPVSNRLESPLT